MGLALSLLGPSVSYLEERLEVSAGVIGILFAVIAASNFTGALWGGMGVTRWNGHVVLRLGVLSLTFGVGAITLANSYAAAAIGALLIGWGTGMADAAMNTMVVWARPGISGPALNAMHLLFGVGALLSPLVIERGLAYTDQLWPMAIVVIIFALASLSILGKRSAPREPTNHAHSLRPVLPTKVVLAVSIFFLLYVGGEVGFSGWIHTYAEDMGFVGSAPALVTALFWASFALARLLAIVLSRIFRPLSIVMWSCGISLFGLIVMIMGDGNAWSIWMGATVFGLASGPQYPTMIAMVDEKLSLSARATAWIVGAAAIGGLIFPVLIGWLIDITSSTAMPMVVLAVCAFGMAWVIVVQRSISHASELDRTSVIHQL